MAQKTEVIHVDPGSDIAHYLESAGGRPLVIGHKGVRFEVKRERTRLNVVDRPRSTHDPERTRAAMRAAAGSWKDIDAEELKEYIHRGTEEGTRPADRPRPIELP